jgi:hypothetical protein
MADTATKPVTRLEETVEYPPLYKAGTYITQNRPYRFDYHTMTQSPQDNAGFLTTAWTILKERAPIISHWYSHQVRKLRESSRNVRVLLKNDISADRTEGIPIDLPAPELGTDFRGDTATVITSIQSAKEIPHHRNDLLRYLQAYPGNEKARAAYEKLYGPR